MLIVEIRNISVMANIYKQADQFINFLKSQLSRTECCSRNATIKKFSYCPICFSHKRNSTVAVTERHKRVVAVQRSAQVCVPNLPPRAVEGPNGYSPCCGVDCQTESERHVGAAWDGACERDLPPLNDNAVLSEVNVGEKACVVRVLARYPHADVLTACAELHTERVNSPWHKRRASIDKPPRKVAAPCLPPHIRLCWVARCPCTVVLNSPLLLLL